MTTSTLSDAGRLIAWAARPKETPLRNVAYRELVSRYLDDERFAADCDAIADGLGLTLHVDQVAGVVAVAEHDSPLRMPLTEFVRQTLPTHRKALAGVVLLAIARVAFPDSAQLDDPNRVARFTIKSVVGFLDRTCERFAEDADDRLAGGADVNELWRAWQDVRETRHNARRDSMGDRMGMVRKVCKFLESEGHLVEVSATDDGGTYRANQRFRISVRALVEDSDAFQDLLAATRPVDAQTSPPGDRSTLTGSRLAAVTPAADRPSTVPPGAAHEVDGPPDALSNGVRQAVDVDAAEAVATELGEDR